MPFGIIKASYIPALLITLLCACNLPRDQRHTWEHVRQNGLEVGVVNNPPYSYIDNKNQAGGEEIEVIRHFARVNKLNARYVSGSESDLIRRLREGEINLLVGGFSEKTIWKDSAGLSIPMAHKKVMLVQKGENRLLYELERFLFSIQKR